MNKMLITVLILVATSACAESGSDCTYGDDFIKQEVAKDEASVAFYRWETGHDRRSNERLKTLHIVYKNGDYAVVQHKYCSMYNFEVAYFRSKQADYLDSDSAGKLVADLYSRHAGKQVTLTSPLAGIVSAALKEEGFDGEKDISVGLPEGEVDYDESVEYSIGYQSLDDISDIYTGAVTFYLGVGGMM